MRLAYTSTERLRKVRRQPGRALRLRSAERVQNTFLIDFSGKRNLIFPKDNVISHSIRT